MRYISCSRLTQNFTWHRNCANFLTGSNELETLCRAPERLKFKLVLTQICNRYCRWQVYCSGSGSGGNTTSEITSERLPDVQLLMCTDRAQVTRESPAANAGQTPPAHSAHSRRRSSLCASPCLPLELPSAPAGIAQRWRGLFQEILLLFSPPSQRPRARETRWQPQLSTREPKQPQSSCFLRPASWDEARSR